MSRSSPLVEGPSGRAAHTEVGLTDSKTIKLAQFDQQTAKGRHLRHLWAEHFL